MSTRVWRERSAVFVLPLVLASGCLLVAPPEDLPALGTGGSGAHGGGGAGGSAAETGGSGGSTMTGGDAGAETNPEGGAPGSGGNAGVAGSGEAGASGGRGGAGGSGGGGKGGTGAKGGTGGSGEQMGGAGQGDGSECTTNQECVDRWAGAPARCRPSDQTCVQLQSNECLLVDEPTNDPNPLYIGSFVPYGDNPANSDVYLAEKLAVDEINAAGGLPGGAGEPSRKLVLVACTNDDSSSIALGMTHLAEEVQVPAVIAMLQPDDLSAAYLQEVEKKLFFLNPVATLGSLTDAQFLRGKGAKGDVLLWTLLGQPRDYAPAYGLLLSDLEKQVRSERGLAPSDEIKVALVNTTDGFSDELRLYIFQNLVFNGTSATNNAQAGDYMELPLDPAVLPTNAMLTDLAAFEPDIVISAAGEVMTNPSGFLPRLESSWTSTKPHPYYLLSPYNATTDAKNSINVVVDAAANATDPEPKAARRFLGVNAAPALDLTLENDFETRYYAAFTNQKAAGTAPNVDNYYDAVYYLAYAMYGGDSLTGPGIANGMKRLVTGTSYDDGNKDMAINNVFAALGDGTSTISLNSTLGPPDFDTTTGVRPVTPGVFCFTNEGLFTLRPNALRYDPTNNEFTGTYPCLANFPLP